MSCTLADLAPGKSRTVRLVVVPLRAGEITNKAFVGADNETNYADNQAAVMTAVSP